MTDAPASTELIVPEERFLDSVPGLREQWVMMVERIPEAGDNAWGRILSAILNADGPEAMEKVWEGVKMEDLIGEEIIVHDVSRGDSRFEGPLGVFLILDCSSTKDGEHFVATTGSINIVAQVTRMYNLGKLPMACVPRKSDQATAAGFYPHRLQWRPMTSVV